MRGGAIQVSTFVVMMLVFLLTISSFPVMAPGGPTGGPVYLVVGGQDKMKTRNLLQPIANDVWTHDVLDRVYDTLGKIRPETDELLPYIVKGVDYDEDGVFEPVEYGIFSKQLGTDQTNIVAYFDFNGVYFHDGVQANASDLFFSYHLQALNPRMNLDLRPLMDKAGRAGSNFSTTRWLFITPAEKNWQNEPTVGDSNLRFAVRFQLQERFALFYQSTLTSTLLLPRHVWEGTGWRQGSMGEKITPLHVDFGIAIYPESDNRYGMGVPTTDSMHFAYCIPQTPALDSAEEWQPTDDDVIGSGPFELDTFNESTSIVIVLKNSLYYTGKDSKTGVTIDSYVETYIHQPYIDGIIFRVYASSTLGIMDLLSGQIDFYHWLIAPEFLPELINNPNIHIWTSLDPGFFYLGYNTRRPGFGMWNWGQTNQFDVGLHFRRAVAHLIDKVTIVKNFLQGYGVPGIVPVSPLNVRYYNSSLIGYDFNVNLAQAEIDLAHQDAVWLANNGGPAEASSWYTYDGNGKLIMPGIGTSEFDLWCPNADYDPVRANACTMIATEMNNMGINVRARPTAFSSIIQIINAHDFDMYILGWRIYGNDPDYLYNFFHSSNAAQSQNYVGFNNATFDMTIEESRREMDVDKRADIIKDVQTILRDNLPYDVLYFRTNIEATRQDRFVGWISQYGSVWNYWSLLNIYQPGQKRLSIIIEIPSATTSGNTETVVVKVKDKEANQIDGANVTLEVSPEGMGNLTWGGSPPSNVYNGTTSSGQMSVSYIAPTVTEICNATITATATYSDFPEATTSVIIKILPIGVNFLVVEVHFLDNNIVPSSGNSRLEISVTDNSGQQKPDAQVTITLLPTLTPPYGVIPSTGYAVDMTQVTFYAPLAIQLPFNETSFRVYVRATYPGYYDGTTSFCIVVFKVNTPPTASFTVVPMTGNVTDVFNFNASSSSDLEDSSTDLEVRWDWEDDGVWDTLWSSNKVAQHQYSIQGIYTVRLEVKDNDWALGNTTSQVTVYNDTLPPVVTITSPNEGQVIMNTSVLVIGTASDSGGSGLQLVEIRINDGAWSIANGTTSWNATVNPGPGSNTIEARAWDNARNPSTLVQISVIYSTYPNASFTITPTEGDTDTVFLFNASTSSDPEDNATILEVRWDWDDDGVWDTTWSYEKTVEHRFTNSGTYTIRLEVRDSSGLTNSTTKQLSVSQAPEPFSWWIVIVVIIIATVLTVISILFLRRRKEPIQPQQ